MRREWGAILSAQEYVIAGAITLAAIIGFAVLASRQQSQDWIRCVNKEKTSPDLQIGGCTTVIQSDKESKNNLAIAFTNRGVAYRNKGQYARAIQDLSLIHISEPTRLGMISYAVFCLKKKKKNN